MYRCYHSQRFFSAVFVGFIFVLYFLLIVFPLARFGYVYIVCDDYFADRISDLVHQFEPISYDSILGYSQKNRALQKLFR